MSKEYVTLGVQRESLLNNPLLQKVMKMLYISSPYPSNLVGVGIFSRKLYIGEVRGILLLSN